MRLVRNGDAIYGYLAESAPDDALRPGRWCLIGSDVDPARPATLLVGMALTAHSGDSGMDGQVAFDQVLFEVPEAEVRSCAAPEPLLALGFDADEGGDPASGAVVQGGDFRPVVVDGRLRLTAEAIGNSANAVWFCVDGGELGSRGFVAEFDAFFSAGAGGCDEGDVGSM